MSFSDSDWAFHVVFHGMLLHVIRHWGYPNNYTIQK